MTKLATMIGPADHGRRMSLDEFDTAEGREGKLYELSRGVIIVTDVPNPPHGDKADKLRLSIDAYRLGHPDVIRNVFTGAECKLLIEPTQSERHPDLAIYKTLAPGDDSSVWSFWIPEIVIEIVSRDSAERDYDEKAEDYLHFGVGEYWIIDPFQSVVTIHRRIRGRWKVQEMKAGQKYSTPLLPGFEMDVAAILAG